MATTKNSPKNTRQAKLVEKPVEGQIVLDPAEAAAESGDFQGEAVPDEQANVDAMKAEIAALKAQLAEANVQPAKAPRTPSAKSLELKAEREALSAHLTDEQIAALANTVPAPHYTYVVTSERIGVGGTGDLTHPSIEEFLILTEPTRQAKKSKNPHSTMKPHSEWKPAKHFVAADALEVVRLHTEEKMKPSAIAERMGCSPTYIGRILSGQQWSKVTGIEFTKKASK
jgi:hypothetical protein